MGGVLEYLNKRKEKWLKDKMKNQMSEMEITELTNQAEDKFSVEKWIPDAAKRAKQLSLASHVAKFSHPDAKASSVISACYFKNDGYLHSGNVVYELDAFGNAAAVDVFEFLLTVMDDNRTILVHLENDSEEIRQELNFLKEEYEKVRVDFLEIKKECQEIKTDERIKQVYFPIGDKYHLLSLMTPSGVLRRLKTRIEEIRAEAIAARDKKNEKYGEQHAEIYDLTVTAFGGTKPQNISALNIRNNGKTYLLASSPPIISKREITKPRQDFFTNTLQIKKFKEDLQVLHALFACEQNNLEIRNKIKKTLQVVVDRVMISVYKLRELEAGWSTAEYYSRLPLSQKIWLDDIHAELRVKNREWLEDVSLFFARWIIRAYEIVLKSDGIPLGDGETAFLRRQVEMALLQDKESFG
ncbi:CRISPR-associated protein Csy1 [Sporomusaceae bacterium FL31]|nr:CRISPR-associated protein Csy1 [Sporomusaceae bacterium FL31]GCE35973.1 CRISPR-associated protein Csy1 [Sporomusaceae bacterium]